MLIKIDSIKLTFGVIIGLCLSASATVMADDHKTSDDFLSSSVNKNGDISMPADFRNTMSHLGSWFVPEGAASGFHDVYAEKEAVDYYRANGVFPDGATIVKELRAHSTGDYSTGSGVSYANEQTKQWFVMVKDSENRFKDNPVWGEGWGWALFTNDSNGKNAATDYNKDCLGCHVPAKENDWIYVEAYPTLGTP